MTICRWLLSVAFVGLLVSCASPVDEDKVMAQITSFHANYSVGTPEDIWSASGEMMRASASKEEFRRAVLALQGRTGKIDFTRRTGAGFVSGAEPPLYVVTMFTSFENGTATEVFHFSDPGGAPRLEGWHMRSSNFAIPAPPPPPSLKPPALPTNLN